MTCWRMYVLDSLADENLFSDDYISFTAINQRQIYIRFRVSYSEIQFWKVTNKTNRFF